MDYGRRNRWLKQMGYQSYSQYLQTQHWYELRLELFKVRGMICQRCGSVKSIHVHHKTYKRIGKEKLSDLLVLCEVCHENIHKEMKLKWKEKKAERKTKVSLCCNMRLRRKPINKKEFRLVCSGCGMRDHRMRRKLRLEVNAEKSIIAKQPVV